jgi:hypothetical protein
VHPNENGQALVAKIVARTVAARRANACAGGDSCGPLEAKAVCAN